MAQQRRFLDVWIVELNTVYREVPFTVVCDWIQQGRLLEDDKVKPSGTREWFTISSSPDFSPYLPRPEPFQAEDEAEALEPVRLDFAWKRPKSDEEDDPDMIPLIDVSLVLLVFFMLTATGVGASIFIKTPTADQGNIKNDPTALWVGIDRRGEGDNTPVYYVGQGPEVLGEKMASQEEMLAKLQEILAKQSGPAEVTINAHPDIRSGVVRQVLAVLGSNRFKARVSETFYGVSQE
jgi:biopolymer transport protein ExbD